jgi:hypothetical protein
MNEKNADQQQSVFVMVLIGWGNAACSALAFQSHRPGRRVGRRFFKAHIHGRHVALHNALVCCPAADHARCWCERAHSPLVQRRFGAFRRRWSRCQFQLYSFRKPFDKGIRATGTTLVYEVKNYFKREAYSQRVSR